MLIMLDIALVLSYCVPNMNEKPKGDKMKTWKDRQIDWICPKCKARNVDDIELSAEVVCEDCEEWFAWEDVALEAVRAYNASKEEEKE